MSNEKFTTAQIAAFKKARAETREYYQHYLVAFSQRSYEYGVQAVKVLITLNGGAVILLPALAELSPNDSGITERLYLPAAFFLLGVVLALVVTYLTHLNFYHLYETTEKQRRKSERLLEKTYLGEYLVSDETPEVLDCGIKLGTSLIKMTFWGPISSV